MPRIAVTPCKRPKDYDAAVRRAGAEPWVPSLADDPAAVVRQVDGVLLTGGDDVDPAFFGEAAHVSFEPAEPGRDAFELELVREALAADVPLLAICRGLQVLNVAAGGTLIQDIPSEAGAFADHSLAPPTQMAHEVAVTGGSRLSRLLGSRAPSGRCTVNSRHHQAIRALGAGLTVSATAPDGIVEAVESPSHRFCVGVQWHPESFHATGEFDELFNGFVDACRTKDQGLRTDQGPGTDQAPSTRY
jgi:putative glutamine amidotransferase